MRARGSGTPRSLGGCGSGGCLDLTQQDLELVHRATQTHDKRLRALAVRSLAKLAHRLEARELRDGAPQPCDRQRCRQVSAQENDPLFETLEPPAKLSFEVLGWQIIEA